MMLRGSKHFRIYLHRCVLSFWQIMSTTKGLEREFQKDSVVNALMKNVSYLRENELSEDRFDTMI